MKCNNCFYEFATKIKAGFTINEHGEKVYMELCERCGDVENIWIPDVYCNSQEVIETLRDRNGQPMIFVSKRQKATYLKERGIMEAGDKWHGGDILDSKPCEVKMDRHKVRAEVKDAVARARAKLKGYDRV